MNTLAARTIALGNYTEYFRPPNKWKVGERGSVWCWQSKEHTSPPKPNGLEEKEKPFAHRSRQTTLVRIIHVLLRRVSYWFPLFCVCVCWYVCCKNLLSMYLPLFLLCFKAEFSLCTVLLSLSYFSFVPLLLLLIQLLACQYFFLQSQATVHHILLLEHFFSLYLSLIASCITLSTNRSLFICPHQTIRGRDLTTLKDPTVVCSPTRENLSILWEACQSWANPLFHESSS